MGDLRADLAAIRDEVIPPIREEAGWPEYDDEPVDPDVLNRYIELLEAAVVGTTSAARMIGRR